MRPPREALVCGDNADVAQLVEHNLAKVGVAGSNPVVRSKWPIPALRISGEATPRHVKDSGWWIHH